MAEIHYAQGVPEALLRQTLPGLLLMHARQRPQATALREKYRGIWREITWQAYFDQVEGTANQLQRLGIIPGDHVGILSDNRPEWLYADLAIQSLGARSVGIYQTNPASDLEYVINHSQLKLLFCEDQEQVDKAIEIADTTPSLRQIVVFDPRGTRHYTDRRLISWAEFIQEGLAVASQNGGWFEAQVAKMDAQSAAMVVYTSGTTGAPKGALLSSENATSLARHTQSFLGVETGDNLLSYLPLCHVAEKIFSIFLPLQSGATVHFGESINTVQLDLKEVSPSVFLGVPRIWEKMHAQISLRMQNASWLKRRLYGHFQRKGQAAARRRLTGKANFWDWIYHRLGDLLIYRPLQEHLGLRRCRLPISGAAPISSELLVFFHGIGIPILEGYGQTECTGVSHCNRPDAMKLGSVGQLIPGTECKLAEDQEILIRGPSVFLGYLNNAEATAKTIDDAGYLATGDLGEIDDAGFLSITGRKKEIIITSGGKNLSPEKIENLLKTSPFIKEAVAIGDQRKFVSALIQIEFDTVGDWANRAEIAYTSFADLSQKPEVVDLIDREIKALDHKLARVESIRKFRLFPKELHQDDGELTATQKVRRRQVLKTYAPLIDEMYKG